MTDPETNAASSGRRPGSIVFGIAVGLLVAFASYQWITDTERRERRAVEEAAVLAARAHLTEAIDVADLEIVDPLAPRRKVGKVYIYAAGAGFEVSGFYRRGEADRWHAYLATLGAGNALLDLKVRDPADAVKDRARDEPRLTIVE